VLPLLGIACALVLALGCGLATGPAAAAENPAAKGDAASPPVAAGPPATIEGFRSARFGLTEDQVRQAVRKDFPAAAAKLKGAVNPSEKTTVLSLTADDLLPGTGKAQISYILGYKSKKLIQVNLVWTSAGSEDSDQAIVGTANALRQYFAAENYKRDSIVANRQVAEHTIIVFRAMDERGRTVLIVLSGAGAALRNAAKAPKPKPPPLTLQLSYIADIAHPDMFRIPKGQF